MRRGKLRRLWGNTWLRGRSRAVSGRQPPTSSIRTSKAFVAPVLLATISELKVLKRRAVSLQRVQVGQEIVHLLLIEHLAKPLHFAAAVTNDFAHAVIIGRQSAERQVLLLENAFHARALLAARGVGLMAAVAILVVEPPSGRLLRIEPEFGVAFAALDLAGGQGKQGRQGDTETQSKTFSIADFRLQTGEAVGRSHPFL